jgi:hypothetical protein
VYFRRIRRCECDLQDLRYIFCTIAHQLCPFGTPSAARNDEDDDSSERHQGATAVRSDACNITLQLKRHQLGTAPYTYCTKYAPVLLHQTQLITGQSSGGGPAPVRACAPAEAAPGSTPPCRQLYRTVRPQHHHR